MIGQNMTFNTDLKQLIFSYMKPLATDWSSLLKSACPTTWVDLTGTTVQIGMRFLSPWWEIVGCSPNRFLKNIPRRFLGTMLPQFSAYSATL